MEFSSSKTHASHSPIHVVASQMPLPTNFFPLKISTSTADYSLHTLRERHIPYVRTVCSIIIIHCTIIWLHYPCRLSWFLNFCCHWYYYKTEWLCWRRELTDRSSLISHFYRRMVLRARSLKEASLRTNETDLPDWTDCPSTSWLWSHWRLFSLAIHATTQNKELVSV